MTGLRAGDSFISFTESLLLCLALCRGQRGDRGSSEFKGSQDGAPDTADLGVRVGWVRNTPLYSV